MSYNIDYEPFTPTRLFKDRHIQTMFSTLFRQQAIPEIERECFELDDGDFVDCYWHHPAIKQDNRPIVILFHGLAGSFHSPYIQGTMHSLSKEGASVVLMHFRGCSDKMNRLSRSYHSGDTADARSWIESLQHRYPNSPLFAIGFSLGGNMLLKLLAEWGDDTPLCGAISVSAPMQLDSCANTMNQGFAQFYQYVLLKNLKRHLLEKYKQHDMKHLIGIDENQVRQLNSFWAFDDVYTGPIHGFTSAKDYYQQCSAKQYLPAIRTNTLILHALDDPFMLPDILPKKNSLPPSVQLEVHDYGGHLGFINGCFVKPYYWLDSRMKLYFTQHVQC
ncbi:MAG: hydrolase [Gammaproteobacteria bacterium]|nr:hydrolase [Gammaproteobacteria bacterium]